jgi:hypothetical protein
MARLEAFPTPHDPHSLVAPMRDARAALVSFIAVLAGMQVVASVAVAWAWTVYGQPDVYDAAAHPLGQIFDRMRDLQTAVFVGLIALATVWTLIVVTLVRTASRRRHHAGVVASTWAISVAAVHRLGVIDVSQHHVAVQVGVLVAQLALIHLPFAAVGGAIRDVGASRRPIRYWYLAATLFFAVNEVFTGRVVLTDLRAGDNLGEIAALLVVNALVLGLIVLFAGDATTLVHHHVADRLVTQHRTAQDALRLLMRSQQAAGAHAPAALTVMPVDVSSIVALPMVSVVPMADETMITAQLPIVPSDRTSLTQEQVDEKAFADYIAQLAATVPSLGRRDRSAELLGLLGRLDECFADPDAAEFDRRSALAARASNRPVQGWLRTWDSTADRDELAAADRSPAQRTRV